MRTNKVRLYILEILLILFLFFALFALNIDKRLMVMIILIAFTILSVVLLSKRKNKAIFEKQVQILMLIFSFIYLGIFYLMGLFDGFVRSKYIFGLSTLIKIIIPLIVIIILSEILRKILLSQNGIIKIKGKKFNPSIILIYVVMTLIDLVIYTGIYSLSNMDDFLMVIGFVLFASLSCNLLYNYMSVRFGYKPIIIFRLITSLYMYIIPYIPDVYIFMRSFLRMLYPFIIYLFLENTYAKTHKAVSYKERKKNILWTGILLVVVALIIMLISCQFKYGIIVIGSESMTGTINKGDAVIYERYDGGNIKEGQVVIFDYNNIKTVHRIIDKSSVNGEVRYMTKGDANANPDSGYRKEDNIDGLVKLRIEYIGLPTLWFRSLFDK